MQTLLLPIPKIQAKVKPETFTGKLAETLCKAFDDEKEKSRTETNSGFKIDAFVDRHFCINENCIDVLGVIEVTGSISGEFYQNPSIGDTRSVSDIIIDYSYIKLFDAEGERIKYNIHNKELRVKLFDHIIKSL
jgi:hypothetical protein